MREQPFDGTFRISVLQIARMFPSCALVSEGDKGDRDEFTYGLTKSFPGLLRGEAHIRQHGNLFRTWFRTTAAAAAAATA
jgi:hypothetical protein